MVNNMGLEKLIKREIGITIAVVLLVTTVFIMFSYAIFKVEVSGDTNVITMGDIGLSLCKDSTCNETLTNLGNIIGTKTGEDGITKYVPIYPQKDPENALEWADLTPYTFQLTNTGTIDLYVSIYLTKENNAELKYTIDDSFQGQDKSHFTEAVNDNQIKIAIGEKDTTPTTKLFSECEEKTVIGETVGREIASNILIKAGENKIFNLYAWLISNAENASQGKYFVTQITAKGEYKPSEEETPETQAE